MLATEEGIGSDTTHHRAPILAARQLDAAPKGEFVSYDQAAKSLLSDSHRSRVQWKEDITSVHEATPRSDGLPSCSGGRRSRSGRRSSTISVGI